MRKPFTKIAAFIFGLIALAHLVRLFVQFEVVLGTHALPIWVSYFGVLVAGVISWRLFKESK